MRLKSMVLLWLLMILVAGCCNRASAAIDPEAGIGLVVPDNENVESAVIGKAGVGYSLNKYVTLGVQASQTGNFTQNDKPQEVQYANANPNAFAAQKIVIIEGDVYIIEDYNDPTVNYNITSAPPILPKRPLDTTERNYWATDLFFRIGIPLVYVQPYFQAGIGASGIKSYDSEHRVGVTKSLGCGLSILVKSVLLSAEASRRFTDTNVNTYGFTELMAKAAIRY